MPVIPDAGALTFFVSQVSRPCRRACDRKVQTFVKVRYSVCVLSGPEGDRKEPAVSVLEHEHIWIVYPSYKFVNSASFFCANKRIPPDSIASSIKFAVYLYVYQ